MLCLQIQTIIWVGGDGSKLKIEKFFEKIDELKNFTCKRYWLIESSWFWNRFRSQNFWHFSAFPSIQLFFNGLVLFFPHQIEPSAHRGPVLKNFRSKNFLLKIIVSPLAIWYRILSGCVFYIFPETMVLALPIRNFGLFGNAAGRT